MKNFAVMAIIGASSVYSTAAFALDDCMIGSWSPDLASMASQIQTAAQAQSMDISGGLQMTIAGDSTGSFQATDLTFSITNAGLPLTTIVMNGTGRFQAELEDGQFAFLMGAFDYTASATVDMPGAPMTMDIPFDESMAPMGGNASGSYECSAASVVFHPNEDGKVVNTWHRQ